MITMIFIIIIPLQLMLFSLSAAKRTAAEAASSGFSSWGTAERYPFNPAFVVKM